MQSWKNFKFKDECKLGVILISYTALLVFLFLNGGVLHDDFVKLSSLMNPFVYGFVIAYLVNPIMNFIELRILRGKKILFRHIRVHRLISIVLTYLIVLFCVFICSIYIIPQLIDSISNIMTSVPDMLESAENLLQSQKEDISNKSSRVAQYINTCINSLDVLLDSWISQVSDYLPKIYDFVMSVTSWLKNFFLGVFISVYMLIHKEKFVHGINRVANILLPKSLVNNGIYVLQKSDEVFGGYIIAKALDSLVIGVLSYISCLILRIPYSMLLAVIIGVTNMIPVFGPIIGGVIGALLLILVDRRACLIYCIMVLIIQQLDGNIIGPKIVGAKLGLASIWVLFGVIVVGGMFGVMGLFIGVPLFAVVFTLIREYIDKKGKQKNVDETEKTEDKLYEEISS